MSALPRAFGSHTRATGWLRPALGLLALVGLALALAGLPTRLAMACVVLPILGSLALWRPSLGVYALAFTVPLGSLYTIHVAGVSVGPSDLVLAAMLVAWVLRIAAHREHSIVVPAVAWWLLVFVGACAVSLLQANDLKAAIPELAKWVEMWCVIVLVANLTEPRERLPICLALLAAGVAESLLGAYQFLWQVGPEGFVLFGRYMRAFGTFQQPNPYAGYLGLLLPLALGMALAHLPAATRVPSRPRPIMLFAIGGGAAVCLICGIVMSWSRGALVGVAAGLVLVGLAMGKRAWALALAGLPLLALLGPQLLDLAPASVLDRLFDSVRYMGQDLTMIEVTDDTFSLVERAAHWQAAWRMFEMRPWLGVGIGQYPVVYPSVAIPRWQDPLGHAHNIYLNLLAEGGLLGLATHLMFLMSWLVFAFRQAWQEHGMARTVAIGALGMLGHLAAHSIVDNLYVHAMYLMMGILLGLLSVENRMQVTTTTSS